MRGQVVRASRQAGRQGEVPWYRQAAGRGGAIPAMLHDAPASRKASVVSSISCLTTLLWRNGSLHVMGSGAEDAGQTTITKSTDPPPTSPKPYLSSKSQTRAHLTGLAAPPLCPASCRHRACSERQGLSSGRDTPTCKQTRCRRLHRMGRGKQAGANKRGARQGERSLKLVRRHAVVCLLLGIQRPCTVL